MATDSPRNGCPQAADAAIRSAIPAIRDMRDIIAPAPAVGQERRKLYQVDDDRRGGSISDSNSEPHRHHVDSADAPRGQALSASAALVGRRKGIQQRAN